MKPQIDPKVEQEIVRHLDGELPESRRADLYRELLKNPAARQMSDEYAANDRLVAGALASLFPSSKAVRAEQALAPLPDRGPIHIESRRVRRPAVWFAAAASVAVLIAGTWMMTMSFKLPGDRVTGVVGKPQPGKPEIERINHPEPQPMGATAAAGPSTIWLDPQRDEIFKQDPEVKPVWY